jgi:hypothetical protein
VSDSAAVVRRILVHIAAPVLVEGTPPEAEALLVDEVSETLADLLAPLTSGAPAGPRQ